MRWLLVSRYGHRVLVIPGGILSGLAGFSLLLRAGTAPTYFSVWLPSSLLVGLGVGLCLPVLSSAAVHGLAPSRFAVGSAVNQSIRALGAVLGVALAIALLGRDPRTAQLPTFQHVFALFVLCGFLTSAASIGIRTHPVAKARIVPQTQAVN